MVRGHLEIVRVNFDIDFRGTKFVTTQCVCLVLDRLFLRHRRCKIVFFSPPPYMPQNNLDRRPFPQRELSAEITTKNMS